MAEMEAAAGAEMEGASWVAGKAAGLVDAEAKAGLAGDGGARVDTEGRAVAKEAARMAESRVVVEGVRQHGSIRRSCSLGGPTGRSRCSHKYLRTCLGSHTGFRMHLAAAMGSVADPADGSAGQREEGSWVVDTKVAVSAAVAVVVAAALVRHRTIDRGCWSARLWH